MNPRHGKGKCDGPDQDVPQDVIDASRQSQKFSESDSQFQAERSSDQSVRDAAEAGFVAGATIAIIRGTLIIIGGVVYN